MTKRLVLTLGSTLGILACDSQVGEDYEGEARAVVAGNVLVASDASVPGEAVNIGIVWLTEVTEFPIPQGSGIFFGNHPYRTSTTVQVDAALPARFSLTIRDLPPADVIAGAGPAGREGTPYWSRGKIAALRVGADPGHLLPDDILGVSANAELIYFTRDATGPTDPLSATATAFNVAPTRGYHVVSRHEDETILATMRECAGKDEILDDPQYSHVCWRWTNPVRRDDGTMLPPDPWIAAQFEDEYDQCKALHDPATTLLCDGVIIIGNGPGTGVTASPDACTHLVYHRDSCTTPEKPWPQSAVVYDGERGPDAPVDVVIGASFFGSYSGSRDRFPATTFK